MENNNNVTVLFDGYSKLSNDNPHIMYSNCTCTLIQTPDNKIIIVDTMTPWCRDMLLNGLKSHNIQPDKVTHVISTHGHSDHVGNNNLFLNGIHIVGNDISMVKDQFLLHDFTKESFRITQDIEIISTPGHTGNCVSVIVRNTVDGTVAIAGDLFEKFEDISKPMIWQEAGSQNIKLQMENRLKVAKLANWIIPGHGEKFQVTKEIIEKLSNNN